MLDYVSVCHCMFMCLMDTDCRRGEPNGAGLSLSASFSLSSFCSGERLSLLEDHPSKLPQLVPSQSRAPQQCRRQCGKFEHPLEHLEQSTKQICLQPHPVSAAIVGNSIIMLLARFRLPLFSINLRLNGRLWFALSVCTWHSRVFKTCHVCQVPK
jgi:hypothetical protein